MGFGLSFSQGTLLLLGLFVAIGLAEILRPARPVACETEGRWWSNLALFVACWAAGALPTITGLAASLASPALQLDLLDRIGLTGPARFAVALLAQDLFAYATHVLQHHVGLLWRFHAIHHADPVIDVSTAVRHHPIEAVFGSLGFGGLVLLLGLTPAEVGCFAVLGLAVQLVAHANLALPGWLTRPTGWLFVTPGFHALHHEREMSFTNSNYGQVLAVWDRLFGTARAGRGPGHVGLPEYDAPEAQFLRALLLRPFLPRRRPGQPARAGASAPARAGL